MKATAESAPAETPSVVGGSLSATINGTSWNAAPVSNKDHDDAIATIDSKTGLLTIRGTSNPSAEELQQIEITLKSSQVGTYTLSPLFAHLQTAQYNIGDDTAQVYFIHEKQSGEVAISQSDGHRLKGTFSFDARNSQGKDIHISNGTFDVPIKQ